jgi:hypothetical protein
MQLVTRLAFIYRAVLLFRLGADAADSDEVFSYLL